VRETEKRAREIERKERREIDKREWEIERRE
jgi:hypothetical protein